ncbi:UDP-2,3-diacylglucosamine diphosphatase [Cyanobium sp. Morenito 9A2]|uniref:UDP-2,3-diacylglucosamine diphosphatase n=1 Tax=Cyanobium sp. Morenito 9A2 TaxID=2823718 RepID=UPI0020CF578F|nr:UDP-2,3-diacylglucosamine diphosphatase [Cyanobium sp. Morenito 9A2]MCP9849825.1 UDP-2,3-diacylglucosamine diphosphatase [Cyanobium sp. Morenito 9A2]
MLDCAALFISDLHLGSNQCEAKELSRFLALIRPRVLYLVGDVIDLQAIRINANVSEAFLAASVDRAFQATSADPLEKGFFGSRRLLRHTHLQVLRDLRALGCSGVKVVYVPGNHDAYLRRYAGLEHDGFAIRREDIYTTPDGRRLLVRHGDEYDGVIHFHQNLAAQLTRLTERYSQLVGLFRSAAEALRPSRPLASWDPEAILQSAVELLAQPWEWPVPQARGLESSDFSLAFALERAIKTRTGHDRVLKRLLTQHLFRENRAGRRLDGVINGHTHIPEVTGFESPPAAPGDVLWPCHITTYNDGSWARSQRQLGRTALVVAHDGTIGMVRFDRQRGIVPFQPPKFPFNSYPQRPCAVCGAPVADLSKVDLNLDDFNPPIRGPLTVADTVRA